VTEEFEALCAAACGASEASFGFDEANGCKDVSTTYYTCSPSYLLWNSQEVRCGMIRGLCYASINGQGSSMYICGGSDGDCYGGQSPTWQPVTPPTCEFGVDCNSAGLSCKPDPCEDEEEHPGDTDCQSDDETDDEDTSVDGGSNGGKKDPTPQRCEDLCETCAARPVDLWTREMYVGPEVDVTVASGIGPEWDLRFSRLYDSTLGKRDLQSDITYASATQLPYPRVVGMGWRHSYGDRLRLINHADEPDEDAQFVIWETETRNVRFGRTSGGVNYIAEPGRSDSLRRVTTTSPITWELVREDGVTLVFKESTPSTDTLLHPWDESIAFHARLDAIYPPGTPEYRIRVKHEQDIVTGEGCVDILGVGQGCSTTRGLLAWVGIETGTTWQAQDRLTFRYVFVDEGSKDEYLMTELLVIERGKTSPVPAKMYFYETIPVHPETHRLLAVRDRYPLTNGAQCPATNAQCDESTYSYDEGTEEGVSPSWALIEVRRDNGTNERVDERFEWASGMTRSTPHVFHHGHNWVNFHESAGNSLRVLSFGGVDPNTGVTFQSVGHQQMEWKLNGRYRRMEFDKNGRPTGCEGDGCRSVSTGTQYQNAAIGDDPANDAALYTLGTKRREREDGGYGLRHYDEQGRVTHEVDVMGGTDPTMTVTTGSYETVAISGSPTLLSARRTYYGANGRPWVVASWSMLENAATTTVYFPLPTNTSTKWFFTGTTGDRALVANAPGNSYYSVGTRYYDVDIMEHDTPDGDSNHDNDVLNQAGDGQTTWAIRVGTIPGSHGVRAMSSTRTIRDRQGRTLEVRTTGDALATVTGLTKNTYFTTGANARFGRLSKTEQRVSTGPDVFMTTWEACSSGTSYQILGESVCTVAPNAGSGAALETSTVKAMITGGYLRTTTTQKTGSTTWISTVEVATPSGLTVQTYTTGGNSSTTTYFDDSDPVPCVGQVKTTIERGYHSNPSAGTALFSTRNTCDEYGRITRTERFVGDPTTGTLAAKTEYLNFDKDGRPATGRRYRDASTPLDTDTTYTNWGAVATEVSPGGITTQTTYDAQARVESIARGFAPTLQTLNRFEYKADGKLWRIKLENGTTDLTMSEYIYDDDGRVVREDIPGAGLRKEFVYDAAGRIAIERSRMLASPNTIIRELSHLYDDMGRKLQTCSGPSSGCSTPEVLYVWDTKGAYAGTYTGVLGRSEGVTLSNEYNLGRLAYVVANGTVYFYEYDPLGRIRQQVRQDGFTGTIVTYKLKATDYAFTSTGALAEVRDPLGTSIVYLYNAASGDKARPSAVSFDTDGTLSQSLTPVATSITYDANGGIASLTWQGGATKTVARNWLGWVTSISSTLGSTLTGYLYDDDGNLLTETDTGSAVNHLTHRGISSHTRALSHDPKTGNLDAWDEWPSWNSHTTLPIGHDILLQPNSGRRREEAVSYPSSGSRTVTNGHQTSVFEAMNNRSWSGGTDNHEEICPTWSSAGEMTSANWGCSGTSEVTNITYAPRGNVSSFDASTGTVSSQYDHEMRRVFKDQVGCSSVELHYGQGRDVLYAHDSDNPTCSGINTKSDRIISVAGERIATYHYKSTGSPTQQIQYLLTDRMGVVRKSFTTSGTMTARMVMNPWGRGEVVQHAASALDVPIVMDFRYPGQYQEEEAWILENGYRVMVPALGQYTSGDPMHSSSVQAMQGPQAYSYAAWRPTASVDPTGQYALDSSWDSHQESKALVQRALNEIKVDPICKCAFEVGYGREPFNDPFGIHYGLSSFAPPPAPGMETHGFSPFHYLVYFGQTQSHLQQYLPELGTTYARIEIGDPTLRAGRLEIRDTLAHEMVHTSFNVLNHSAAFPSPDTVGLYCSGRGPPAFMSREMRACCNGCSL